MLILRRRPGQWVEVTHVASGDTFRIRTGALLGDPCPSVNLAMDDPARLFRFERSERADRARVAEAERAAWVRVATPDAPAPDAAPEGPAPAG